MAKPIYLKNITKKYRSGWILGPLNLQINEGEIFGFLGPNGAGKTTTIKLLLGLIKPSSGKVNIFNEDPFDNIPVRQRKGYVTEDNILYPYLTPTQLIEIIKPYYLSWDDDLVKTSLDRFDIPIKQRIATFSAGMKQKLEIILSLASRPALLILDEPTGKLDPVMQREFLKLLLENKGEQQTIFLSSHRLSEVERIADRVGIIKDGKLLVVKDLDEIKTGEKKIRVVFLNKPPDNLFSLAGVVNVRQEKDSFLITTDGKLNEVLEELHKYSLLSMEIIDQNLEQIFFHYFSEGEEDCV